MKTFRWLAFFSFFAIFCSNSYVQAQEHPGECSRVITILQEGDLIFEDVPNFIFKQVAKATGGWVSHVGVAFLNGDHEWMVAESHIPFSGFTPVCDYLDRIHGGHIAVRRPTLALTPTQIGNMRTVAIQDSGILYDTGFNLTSGRQFCSKFVHDVYERGANREIGRIETFSQLLDEIPDAAQRDESLRFWKIWFLGFIPWDRYTITPQSEFVDPNFKTLLDIDPGSN